ncbi:MAG: LamG domain-containing protein, partial [archaeon]|nr:LamG domain-containing protein [archaeon]
SVDSGQHSATLRFDQSQSLGGKISQAKIKVDAQLEDPINGELKFVNNQQRIFSTEINITDIGSCLKIEKSSDVAGEKIEIERRQKFDIERDEITTKIFITNTCSSSLEIELCKDEYGENGGCGGNYSVGDGSGLNPEPDKILSLAPNTTREISLNNPFKSARVAGAYGINIDAKISGSPDDPILVRNIPVEVDGMLFIQTSPFIIVNKVDDSQTITQPQELPPTSSTIFQANFNDTATAEFAIGNKEALQNDGTQFATGYIKKAIVIDENDKLSYSAKDNFNSQQGTLEFWVKPNWNKTTPGSHTLFAIKENDSEYFKLSYKIIAIESNRGFTGYTHHLLLDGQNAAANGPLKFQFIGATNWWQPGDWHHVAVTWGGTTNELFIDGVNVASNIGLKTINITDETKMWIGASAYPTFSEIANASFDSLKISKIKKTQTAILGNYLEEKNSRDSSTIEGTIFYQTPAIDIKNRELSTEGPLRGDIDKSSWINTGLFQRTGSGSKWNWYSYSPQLTTNYPPIRAIPSASAGDKYNGTLIDPNISRSNVLVGPNSELTNLIEIDSPSKQVNVSLYDLTGDRYRRRYGIDAEQWSTKKGDYTIARTIKCPAGYMIEDPKDYSELPTGTSNGSWIRSGGPYNDQECNIFPPIGIIAGGYSQDYTQATFTAMCDVGRIYAEDIRYDAQVTCRLINWDGFADAKIKMFVTEPEIKQEIDSGKGAYVTLELNGQDNILNKYTPNGPIPFGKIRVQLSTQPLDIEPVFTSNIGLCEIGNTGEAALPKIGLTKEIGWKFNDIGLNTCAGEISKDGSKNNDYIYCDATQFSISLMERIHEVSQLINANSGGYSCP